MSPKPCKWCSSIWHSKNKCPKREKQALPDGFIQKRTNVPLLRQKPSDELRLAYKGSSERSQLIGWADKYFSLYIRQRDSDGSDNHCYTCGRKFPIDELQCGHFMSRRFLKTRWDEINCHPQCNECNVDKHGNLIVYEVLLRRDYGDLEIDKLKQFARSGKKVSQADIREVIDLYKGVVF